VGRGLYAKALDQVHTELRNVWLGSDLGTDNQIGDARQVRSDRMYEEQTHYQVVGSITEAGDRDFYKLKSAKVAKNETNLMRVVVTALDGADFVPILRVYDDGRNLVQPRIVTASAGTYIVELDYAKSDKDYFLEVLAGTGTGDYLVTTDFQETKFNDSFDRADELKTTPGFKDKTHYERVGRVWAGADLDFYKFRSANVGSGKPSVMTVHVRSLGTEVVNPVVTVYDAGLRPVAATILRNTTGAYTIQVGGMLSDKDYYVRVGAAQPSGPNAVGDYSLVIDFGVELYQETTFAADTLGASNPQDVAALRVTQNQLFHFALSAALAGTGPETLVRMTVFDVNGRVVFTLAALADETRTGDVFLAAGDYTVRFAAATRDGSAIPSVAYTLRGKGLSDPIGPTVDDPTLAPVSPTSGSTLVGGSRTESDTGYYWMPVLMSTTLWTDVYSDPWFGW
jgi:hypothetical protein